MDDFSRAQQLFVEFQKNQKNSVLEEILDLLDELLLGADKQRAENLKATIDRFFNNERKQIFGKYNIRDFVSPQNDVLSLLANSVSEPDLKRVQNLMSYYVRPILQSRD
jgi:hypothetical protein